MKPIVKWISEKEVEKINTSRYWNDIEKEKKKEWWIKDKNDEKLLNYLHSSGLLEEYKMAQMKLEKKGLLSGRILDVAAGVCWTSALLSKHDKVKHIDALDFSWHRLEKLAPIICEQFQAKEYKIQRIFGSFYDLKNDKESYDLVFMSQAFHHADSPLRLLYECDRVLKSGGG